MFVFWGGGLRVRVTGARRRCHTSSVKKPDIAVCKSNDDRIGGEELGEKVPGQLGSDTEEKACYTMIGGCVRL